MEYDEKYLDEKYKHLDDNKYYIVTWMNNAKLNGAEIKAYISTYNKKYRKEVYEK